MTIPKPTHKPAWWAGHSNTGIDIDTLMSAGVALAANPVTDGSALHAFVGRLMNIENGFTPARLCAESAAYSAAVLDKAFERGWLPAELVHVVGHAAEKPAVPMLVVLLGDHARRSRAFSRAPEDWRSQLRGLDVDPGSDLGRHRSARRVTPRTFWTTLLRVLATVSSLPTMIMTGPPPSRWGDADVTHSAHTSDVKVLNKIRGLLAKAESSTFSGERELFSAKAQELMTRYAIDSAMIDARSSGPSTMQVVTRRFTVANPYVDAKMRLFSAVARPNGVRTVRFMRFGLIAAVGMPVDIDLCELLYTSLLVQSSKELDEVGTDPAKRGRGFRRSFLFAYAIRIEERITEAHTRARQDAATHYGSALVPVFAQRDRAVETRFTEMFPSLKSKKTTFSNSAGWQDGWQAAGKADITGGRRAMDE